MKTLFGILLVVLVCASAQAQAPFRRNAYTTNATPSLSAVTNTLGLTGSALTFLRSDGQQAAPAGGGNVVGPGASTDNAITRFDGATGTLVQNSTVLVGDGGAITGVDALTATNTVTAGAFVAGSTNMVTALDLKAPLASPTFTGTATFPTPFTLGAVSVLPTGTELNFVDGVTSAIQTQIDAKAALVSPSFTTPTLGVATATTLDTGQGANELYDMDQDVLTTSTPTFPGVTLSPNGKLNIVWTNLATTPLAGLTLSNATLAVVGTQVQDSPALAWQGNVWLTGSASNATTVFRSYVLPVTGATAPGFNTALKFDSSMNSGAYVTVLTLDSVGTLTGVNDWITLGRITAGAAQGIAWTGKSLLKSSANGAIEATVNAQSSMSTIQFNLPQTTKTANHTNAVALDSGMRFVNIGAGGAITNFLPASVALQQYEFYVDAAQIYSIKANGTDVIRDAAVVSGAGMDIWSNAAGSSIVLFCPKAGVWAVKSKNGAWTNNP